MANEIYLGQDLNLGFIADEEGNVFAGPHSHVDLQSKYRENVSPREKDLSIISGRANLVQSLIVRLKTERGELEKLGHPYYGSRHHRLIGEPNTENNRNLIKLNVLECLRQEPRIEISGVEVKTLKGPENLDKVKIEIDAVIKHSSDSLNLVIPFSFESPLE